MSTAKPDSTDTLCPRCGAEANWSFADDQKSMVEIACPDCGHFTVSTAEFEQAEFDLATPDDTA